VRSTPAGVVRSLLLAVALAGCGTAAVRTEAPAPRDRLATLIDSIVSTPPLQRTHWGVYVHDPAAGSALLEYDARRHYIPASNTKLVVGTVALGELGPAFRYETRLSAAPGPADSIASGVLLVASGDPTLSSRFLPDDFAALDSLAAAAAAAGLRHIAGDLVIDASSFDDVRVLGAWEVGDLPFTYAAPVGAFAIAEGTFALVRIPGPTVGAPATVRVLGGDHLQPVRAAVVTDTAGARTRWEIDYLERRDTITIIGSIALGQAPDTVRLAVTDPVGYAARALADALGRHGIVLGGMIRVVTDSAEASAIRTRAAGAYRIVAIRRSPPMADIVAAILQPSQNWIAEQVLKTLGAERRGQGSWSSGLDVERRYLIDVVGIDSLAFSLRDASGLSAQNLLTPRTIVRLLEHARVAPWGGDFRRALAAPGLRGSTLSGRLEGLEGRVQAKTGTIANVNSLSGFLTTDSGRALTFSIMTNGSGLPAAAVRRAIDRLVMEIAREGGRR
jgi:D-alanyl-D-alanine carboxypeptidase/D-alanyl-D-alanine-endopeptidase (penicillin-binding protein 4)